MRSPVKKARLPPAAPSWVPGPVGLREAAAARAEVALPGRQPIRGVGDVLLVLVIVALLKRGLR